MAKSRPLEAVIADEMPWVFSSPPEYRWDDEIFKDVDAATQHACSSAASGKLWFEPEAGIAPKHDNALDGWAFVTRRHGKNPVFSFGCRVQDGPP